jgi:hypothetical protein
MLPKARETGVAFGMQNAAFGMQNAAFGMQNAARAEPPKPRATPSRWRLEPSRANPELKNKKGPPGCRKKVMTALKSSLPKGQRTKSFLEAPPSGEQPSHRRRDFFVKINAGEPFHRASDAYRIRRSLLFFRSFS